MTKDEIVKALLMVANEAGQLHHKTLRDALRSMRPIQVSRAYSAAAELLQVAREVYEEHKRNVQVTGEE